MRLVRSQIGVFAMVTLVSLLGTAATPLANACCTADAAETTRCTHHDGVRQSAPVSDTADGDACPMHETVDATAAVPAQSMNAAHLCACTTDSDAAVSVAPGLLTASFAVTRSHVAALATPAGTFVPLRTFLVPPLPPPRPHHA